MDWIIEDWTGKRLFPNKSFKSFDDGWNFIYGNFPEEDWQDLYVEKSSN